MAIPPESDWDSEVRRCVFGEDRPSLIRSRDVGMVQPHRGDRHGGGYVEVL